MIDLKLSTMEMDELLEAIPPRYVAVQASNSDVVVAVADRAAALDVLTRIAGSSIAGELERVPVSEAVLADSALDGPLVDHHLADGDDLDWYVLAMVTRPAYVRAIDGSECAGCEQRVGLKFGAADEADWLTGFVPYAAERETGTAMCLVCHLEDGTHDATRVVPAA